MSNRLYRSRSERMWCGVCGGLAQYFDIDPTLVRLAFVIMTLIGGAGILLYIILWIVMPDNPDELPTVAGFSQPPGTQGTGELERSVDSADLTSPALTGTDRRRNSMFFGGLLILVGAYLILQNLNFPFFGWFNGAIFWPLLLILLGIVLILRRAR
jgi:phage shock protein C